MFTGLCAFPLTPLRDERLDEAAFGRLVQRLVEADVDSIGVLGSTGNYAYLDRGERSRIAQRAVEQAGDIPVIVGIGALRTRDVLAHAEDAQKAGAHGLLLAPMSYQPLRESEVFDLYAAVSASVSIPLCVYDNPTTTHFQFSDELHGAVAALPGVKSIKIPGMPWAAPEAEARVAGLRRRLPDDVTIGISGDAFAATGLNAGCQAWYSVIGGLFPAVALAITRAARSGNPEKADRLSQALEPFWQLYASYGGSLRVIATAAEQLGLVQRPCLPLPLQTLDAAGRRELDAALAALDLR